MHRSMSIIVFSKTKTKIKKWLVGKCCALARIMWRGFYMASKPLTASRLDQCQATSFKSDSDKCERFKSEGGIHSQMFSLCMRSQVASKVTP